ncbi:MAG: hypothetical protein ACI89X_000042 [Planctomycetota bacterium]|jgi:hypothetical protein
MMNRLRWLLLAVSGLLLAGCKTTDPAATWTSLFDGESLTGWQATEFGGEGEITVADGAMHFEMGSPMTGVTLTGPPPTGSYEVEVTAARIEGNDFFCGLTFPVGEHHLTLVLGGWGGSISGLSSLDDDDASRNLTRKLKGFKSDLDYTTLVRVTDGSITVLLDGEPFTETPLAGKRLSLRPEVDLCRPFGIASFQTRTRIKTVRWRPLATR